MAQTTRFREHCGEAIASKFKELDDMTEQIVIARICKLEVLVARTLTKDTLKKDRKQKLVLEQLGSFVKDLKDWRITAVDHRALMWGRLAKVAGFKEHST